MNEIVDSARAQLQIKSKRSGITFLDTRYRKKEIEEVNWLDLCEDAHRAKETHFGFLIMRELLRANLYHGCYAEELYNNMWIFNQLDDKCFFGRILCGEDIPNLVVYTNPSKNDEWHCMLVKTENYFVKDTFTQYLNSESVYSIHSQHVLLVFEESLGKYRHQIATINDFSAKTLFQQANYYNKYLQEDEYKRKKALGLLVAFYRWIVKTHPEKNFISESFEFSDTLLFSSTLSEMLFFEYYFTPLNPHNIPYGKERICFLLKGFENQSTALVKNGYIPVDFSRIQSQTYRDLAIEYIATSTTVASIPTAARTICEVMQALYEVKQTKGYPNSDLTYLTNQEAIFIRRYIDSQDISTTTKNIKITNIRPFLSYCVSKKAIHIDELFNDYLIAFGKVQTNTACVVPDDSLVAIHNTLLKKAEKELFYKEMLVIFHLAIQTEFRINQICHLEVDCIKPTLKPNQFIVQSISKTSHGLCNSYVISMQTYRLLMDAIEATEEIRTQCCLDSVKNYIFLYPSGRNSSCEKPNVFNDIAFSRTLKEICDELGIARYTANNLRDTHMTKSLEHIMRTGKSDLEMSVLSKHKHIDTTKNHYIEMELEKMLESTYGITIGTELIETDSKIVDDIPEHLVGEENDVEDGCGKCSAETCVMTNALPCMACKHFITTTKHEIFFKKAIENVNRLIENTKNRHDKEDLVTIKELYVLYLKAIIKHKESN